MRKILAVFLCALGISAAVPPSESHAISSDLVLLHSVLGLEAVDPKPIYECPDSFSRECGSFTPPPCGPGVDCIYKCSVKNEEGHVEEMHFCNCKIIGPGTGPGNREYGYDCLITKVSSGASF
jgi:hypothetical protein